MKLFDLLGVLAVDIVVHIRDGSDMIIFSGTIVNAYRELDEKNFLVHRVDKYLGGLLIEVYPEE